MQPISWDEWNDEKWYGYGSNESNAGDAKKRSEAAKPILDGKTYFSGNTALCNYELHSFLTGLGMKPLLLQISDLTPYDEQWRKEILTHCDPYVTRAANIGPLQYLYPILKPQFNLGA